MTRVVHTLLLLIGIGGGTGFSTRMVVVAWFYFIALINIYATTRLGDPIWKSGELKLVSGGKCFFEVRFK